MARTDGEWAYQVAVGLALLVAGGAFFYGKHQGRRDAPRVITDRQACQRWAGRCLDAKGNPWINRWDPKLPECEKKSVMIDVE